MRVSRQSADRPPPGITSQHEPALPVQRRALPNTKSAHDHRVHTEEVTGSIPVSPTQHRGPTRDDRVGPRSFLQVPRGHIRPGSCPPSLPVSRIPHPPPSAALPWAWRPDLVAVPRARTASGGDDGAPVRGAADVLVVGRRTPCSAPFAGGGRGVPTRPTRVGAPASSCQAVPLVLPAVVGRRPPVGEACGPSRRTVSPGRGGHGRAHPRRCSVAPHAPHRTHVVNGTAAAGRTSGGQGADVLAEHTLPVAGGPGSTTGAAAGPPGNEVTAGRRCSAAVRAVRRSRRSRGAGRPSRPSPRRAVTR